MNTLLTADEVASKLRLTRSTIFKLSSKGMIPRIKIGAALRFDPHEIERWIEDQKHGACQEKYRDC